MCICISINHRLTFVNEMVSCQMWAGVKPTSNERLVIETTGASIATYSKVADVLITQNNYGWFLCYNCFFGKVLSFARLANIRFNYDVFFFSKIYLFLLLYSEVSPHLCIIISFTPRFINVVSFSQVTLSIEHFFILFDDVN